MSADIQQLTGSKPDANDPFRIGYRHVTRTDERGARRTEMVPLTEEDFLHPQEEDRFMLTDAHTQTVSYVQMAIRWVNRGRPDVRVFSDHRIDWQVGGVQPHGPDIVAFEEFRQEWDPLRGTLPVKDLGAEPLAVIEVTSEATRHVDLGRKVQEYHAAGVPYYVIIDLVGPMNSAPILVYRWSRQAYRLLRGPAEVGYPVPPLEARLRWVHGEVVLTDDDGNDAPSFIELCNRYENAESKAAYEKDRADVAVASAKAERERADALARELAELKARLNGTK